MLVELVDLGTAMLGMENGNNGPVPVYAGRVNVVSVPPTFTGMGGGRRLDDRTEVVDVSLIWATCLQNQEVLSLGDFHPQ